MNTVEILQAAKAKIADPKNWTQDFYAKDEEGNNIHGNEPRATCFCSLGALESVVGISHMRGGWQSKFVKPLDAAAKARGFSNIAYCNDGSTHEEVMAVWDKAIELAIAGEGAK